MVKQDAKALTQKEEQGVRSRRRILDATLSIMAERGYAAASISAISKKSKLPASSIYWHFESKEGLLTALLDDGAQRFVDSLLALDTNTGTQEERLIHTMERSAEALEARPLFLRLLILLGLEKGEDSSPILSGIRDIRQKVVVKIAESIMASVDTAHFKNPEETIARIAEYCLIVVDGSFVARQLDPTADLKRLFKLHIHALQALLLSDEWTEK